MGSSMTKKSVDNIKNKPESSGKQTDSNTKQEPAAGKDVETSAPPNGWISQRSENTIAIQVGRTVETQTDENDWKGNEDTHTSNNEVTYVIETVDNEDGLDKDFSGDRSQEPVTKDNNRKETSTVGTNTTSSPTERKVENEETDNGSAHITHEQDNEFVGVTNAETTNHKAEVHDSSLDELAEVHDGPLDGLSLEKYGKYKVKVESDKEKCTISSVTFLDTGDLILIDRSNQKIKFVDSDFRYISGLDLPAKPWALCARGVDVYVTIGNTRIQHLYVKDMLIEPERTFEIKGRCLGICIYGEYIAVGLQIGEIHLLDTVGEKHETLPLPLLDTGKPCNPWHMFSSKEGNLLVTDSDAGTVFCINKDAQVVYKFMEISSPRGAVVDSLGNILVVGRDMETGIVAKLLPRDWELRGMLHMEQQQEMTGSKGLITWGELEFVPYCVGYRSDNIVVLGGIQDTLKIMRLSKESLR